MIDVARTTTGAPSAAQLASFKEYAAMNGGASDAMLTDMLRRAMVAVQEWEDKTLLAASVKITATAREDDPTAPVTLYGWPLSVASVADGDGNAVDFSLIGRQVFPKAGAAALVIDYTTAPVEGIVNPLLPKVYRYACALYDGMDAKDLNAILMED